MSKQEVIVLSVTEQGLSISEAARRYRVSPPLGCREAEVQQSQLASSRQTLEAAQTKVENLRAQLAGAEEELSQAHA